MQSASRPPHRRRIAHMRARHAPLQVVEQMIGRVGAGVGLQQRDLEVLVQLVADLGADEAPARSLEPVRCSPLFSLASQPARSASLAGSAAAARAAGGRASAGGSRGAARRRRAADARRRPTRAGFLPNSSSPTSALSQSRRPRWRALARRRRRSPAARAPRRPSARGHRPAAPRRAAAGGFFLKKLNMEGGCAGAVEAPQTALQGRSRSCDRARDRLAILVGSGALAQSVRATES